MCLKLVGVLGAISVRTSNTSSQNKMSSTKSSCRHVLSSRSHSKCKHINRNTKSTRRTRSRKRRLHNSRKSNHRSRDKCVRVVETRGRVSRGGN